MRLHLKILPVGYLTAARYFFFAVAIACLGTYGYVYLERILYQTYESWRFERRPARSPSAAQSPNRETAINDRLQRSSGRPASRPSLRSPTALIGRLSVPRLHLSAMVREGVDGDTLRLAVGHIPATVLPGEPGNVGVAGHRDTFFRGLKDLRTGDEIQFSTLTGDFTYKVESLVVVEPGNVGVLAPSSENVLTLVTCYPFSYIGAAPKRFIVRAKQLTPRTFAQSDVER